MCCRLTGSMDSYHWLYIVSAIVLSVFLFFMMTSNAVVIHTRNTLIAIFMIFAIVQLCKKINRYINIGRKSLLAQTFQIYIMSWPCQLLAGIVVERILHLSWMVFIPIVFATGVVAPLILLKLIGWIEEKTHNNYISLILGR